MKAITKLLSQIEAQRASIDRLRSDYDSAQKARDSGTAHVAELEALKAQRRTLLAEALVAKKAANTATIDAKIANTEQQHTAAQAAAANASDQLEIVREGIEIAEAELSALTVKLAETVAAEMMSRYEQALEQYRETVDALGVNVAELVAINNAWNHIDNSIGLGNFPGYSQNILEGIRSTGVRVPYTGSRLVDPVVAAGYTDDYKNFLYVPSWADAKTFGFADDQTGKLIAEIKSAGVPCAEQFIKTPPAPAKQLKVRVIHGSVSAAGPVIRRPNTEEVVSRPEHTYVVGDDFMVDESDARNLRSAGMVLIHGEDRMPEPAPPTSAPRRVDAFIDQGEVYMDQTETGSRGDSYVGFRSAIDLGAY